VLEKKRKKFGAKEKAVPVSRRLIPHDWGKKKKEKGRQVHKPASVHLHKKIDARQEKKGEKGQTKKRVLSLPARELQVDTAVGGRKKKEKMIAVMNKQRPSVEGEDTTDPA